MEETRPGSSSVRVVSWNCKQGLTDDKARRLLELRPDVAIVQECAAATRLDGLTMVAWHGKAPYQGLALFVRTELDPVALPVSDAGRRWGLAVRLQSLDVDVVGVHGFKRNGEAGPPRGVARDAIASLAEVLARGRTILIGDFNDGPYFDAGHGRSFRKTWDLLASTGYTSAYHLSTGENYGTETARTFFRGDRSFFIDHAFIPTALAPLLRSYEIGSIREWRPISDHLPLTMDMAIAGLGTT